MRRPRSRMRDESGQTTVLIIGFAVILGLAVAVVVNASNVFLHRRSLMSWADGAVTVAAQEVAYAELYSGLPAVTLPLSETAARQAVTDYAGRHGLADRFDGFAVASVDVEPETSRVSVTLTAAAPLMLAGDVTEGLTSFRVTARASAVVPLE